MPREVVDSPSLGNTLSMDVAIRVCFSDATQ